MSEADSEIASAEKLLESMRAARDVPAVLKTRLATFRSVDSTSAVFVFEGPEDKTVYYHWIRRVRPLFTYEPFPCGGKDGVLRLLEVLTRDVTGLAAGVYFFVDRDFDDLKGYEPNPAVFMTDRYSFENYLVCEEVLEEVMKNEFHCHGDPLSRQAVKKLFSDRFEEFLQVTRDINQRLFVAARFNIRRSASISTRISMFATVSLESIGPSSASVTVQVPLTREPTLNETESAMEDFSSLSPGDRYRGKFALLFFRKWLSDLAEDRNSEKPHVFSRPSEGKVPTYISLDSFAARSPMPLGLEAFIQGV